MENNLEIYEKVRTVPATAQKTIQAGKIKGFTDINPMWRIRALTEVFGPCGIGWYYTIDSQWLEPGPDGKTAAFCNISLYVKVGEEWSKPIIGTGGSAFVNLFKGSKETSDECYKMALTDALSVACKALGIGADVYWKDSRTKYDQASEAPQRAARAQTAVLCDEKEKKVVYALCGSKEKLAEMLNKFGNGENWNTMSAGTALKIKQELKKENESANKPN